MNMSKFDEMLEVLNKKSITQETYLEDFQCDLHQEIVDAYFTEEYDTVAKDIDIDRHRWYELSTTVFKFGDRFLGVRGVSNVFSENMGWGDCDISYDFFEMKEVYTIAYKAV